VWQTRRVRRRHRPLRTCGGGSRAVGDTRGFGAQLLERDAARREVVRPAGVDASVEEVLAEVLGLRWTDLDAAKATLSINRGLVAVGYELHETRGKTRNARRRVDLDPTTVGVVNAWREWQRAEHAAVGIETAGWMFTDGNGEPIHPHAISQTFERIARRASVPVIRLHDVRHTHATLLIAAGVPVKVVSERLGHGNPAFTIDTYQHVLPGMQATAARVFEQLVMPGLLPAEPSREKTRENRRKKTA
jgi:integrase